MPAEPTPKVASSSRKRPVVSKRGAIACVRCKERKAKCVPAPPNTSSVPTCTNCFAARAECVYLDRTPNELFLLEYVTQLEARVAFLETELLRYTRSGDFTSHHAHAQTQAAAVDALNKAYPPGSWPSADGTVAVTASASGQEMVQLAMGDEGKRRKAADTRERASPPEDEEDLARGIGLLSLSGSGEPVFVGASSGVNWARVCATALRRPNPHAPHLSRFHYMSPPESSSVESALAYSMNHPIPPLPPAPLAARYLDVAYGHIQSLYPFLDWPTIRSWHDNREAICLNRPFLGAGRGPDYGRSMAAFFLWLLYGFGARLTEGENLEGAVSHELYHNVAIGCLSEVSSHHSVATVRAELLLTIYTIRHPHPEISVWHCGGLALRTAIQIGLHRRARSRAEREANPVQYELRKRVFWSVYTVDRMLALQLGRPSGIQDRDIDTEFPLNIDVDYADAKEIAAMQLRQIEAMAVNNRKPGEEYANGYGSVSSMTSSLHHVRLTQLMQLIQDAIYRLDKPRSRPDAKVPDRGSAEIDEVLHKLDRWAATKPVLPPGRSGVPLMSPALYDLEYHNCVQMLLRPVISTRRATDQYVVRCGTSAMAYCEIEYTLYNPLPADPRMSNWGLYKLFLSGLTLLHLASDDHTRHLLDLSRASAALRTCLETLKIYIRFLPSMRGYLECFEDLLATWNKGKGQGQKAKTKAGPAAPAVGVARSSTGGPARGHMLASAPIGPQSRSQDSGPVTASSSTGMPHRQLSNHSPTQRGDGTAIFASHAPRHENMVDGRVIPLPGSGPSNIHGQSQGQGQGQGLGQQAHGIAQARGHGAHEDALGSLPPSSLQRGQHWSDFPPYENEYEGRRQSMGMRDDFFSLLSSLGVDTSVGESLPPIGEDVWSNPYWLHGELYTMDAGASAEPTGGASAYGLDHAQGPELTASMEWLDGLEAFGSAHPHPHSHPHHLQHQSQDAGAGPETNQGARRYGWE